VISLDQLVQALLKNSLFGPIVSLISAVVTVVALLRVLGTLTESRFRNISERSQAVAYWQNWLNVQQAAATPEQFEAAKAIAYNKLNELALDSNSKEFPATGSAWAKRMLLFHPPPRAKVYWISRSGFHLALMLWIGCLIWAILKAEHTLVSILENGLLVAVLLLLAGLVRAFALILERGLNSAGAAKVETAANSEAQNAT